jgi:hypothetical protein
MKLETTHEELFKGYPAEFVRYLSWCRDLKFQEKPDYEYARKIFQGLLHRLGHSPDDTDYDWVIKREALIREHFPESPELIELEKRAEEEMKAGGKGSANRKKPSSSNLALSLRSKSDSKNTLVDSDAI